MLLTSSSPVPPFFLHGLRSWHRADLGVHEVKVTKSKLNVSGIGFKFNSGLSDSDDFIKYSHFSDLTLSQP